MPVRKERPILKGIKHGRSGYQEGCGCDVCRKGEADYQAKRRRERGRDSNGTVIPMNKRTESNDSDARRRTGGVHIIGDMEQAVIDECKQMRADGMKVRPTVEVAARNLAKIVDDPESRGMHTATTKQIMALLETLQPKEIKQTGRKKSGGRLATVANLTKVKRQA